MALTFYDLSVVFCVERAALPVAQTALAKAKRENGRGKKTRTTKARKKVMKGEVGMGL